MQPYRDMSNHLTFTQTIDIQCKVLLKTFTHNDFLIIDLAYQQYLLSQERFNKYDYDEKNDLLITLSDDEKQRRDACNPLTPDLVTYRLYTLAEKLNLVIAAIDVIVDRLLSYNIFKLCSDQPVESYQDNKWATEYEFTYFGIYVAELCRFRDMIN